jgi:hypothetical protein
MHAVRRQRAWTEPRWHTTGDRPLTREDVGLALIARDCCGNWIAGKVAESRGDVVLRPNHAVLRLDIPVSLLDEYQFAEPDS